MNRLRFSIWHFVLRWLVVVVGGEREDFDGHLVGGPSSQRTLSALVLLVLNPPDPRNRGFPPTTPAVHSFHYEVGRLGVK